VIGAALLWVVGSALMRLSTWFFRWSCGMAMLVTQIAAAAAVLSWLAAEWIGKGKPSVLGAISGAVAGLVAITPAAGFVLPGSALIIGLVAGVAGYWGATALKARAEI
jgi:ammonium transporter, Amt family